MDATTYQKPSDGDAEAYRTAREAVRLLNDPGLLRKLAHECHDRATAVGIQAINIGSIVQFSDGASTYRGAVAAINRKTVTVPEAVRSDGYPMRFGFRVPPAILRVVDEPFEVSDAWAQGAQRAVAGSRRARR